MSEATLKVVQGPIGYLVVAGVVIGVAYWLIKKVQKKGEDLTKPFASAIGDAVAWATLPADIVALGQIRLPSGEVVSVNTIAQGSGIDSNNRFSYGGGSYTLGPRGADGIYTAS